MLLNFEYYHVFYIVAKCRNITRAAEELHISQPSVSRSLQTLESYLNCKLCVRTRYGVQLTMEGEELFKKIGPAYAAICDAEVFIKLSCSGERGMIRIGTNEHGACLLIPSIKAFHEKYPKVLFQINRLKPSEIVPALRVGQLDFVIDFDDFSHEAEKVGVPGDISFTPVCVLRDEAIAGTDYVSLCEAGTVLRVRDLAQYPVILPQIDSASKAFYRKLLMKEKDDFSPLIEVSGATIRIKFVEQNMGISFIPKECITEELETGKILILPTEEALMERKVCLMTSSDHLLSAVAKNFLEFLNGNLNSGKL